MPVVLLIAFGIVLTVAGTAFTVVSKFNREGLEVEVIGETILLLGLLCTLWFALHLRAIVPEEPGKFRKVDIYTVQEEDKTYTQFYVEDGTRKNLKDSGEFSGYVDTDKYMVFCIVKPEKFAAGAEGFEFDEYRLVNRSRYERNKKTGSRISEKKIALLPNN